MVSTKEMGRAEVTALSTAGTSAKKDLPHANAFKYGKTIDVKSGAHALHVSKTGGSEEADVDTKLFESKSSKDSNEKNLKLSDSILKTKKHSRQTMETK